MTEYVIDAKENDIKSVVIVAFTKKEAGNLFIRWAKAKGLYERITAIVVQRTKKTKANKHMFAIDFYEKQNAFICDLERKAEKLEKNNLLQITEKGIPVVSSDVAENVEQYAEIEAAEIILSRPVTEIVEDFYNKYKNDESDDIVIELGKFLVEQILHNTIDKDKIIKKTE